MRDTGCSLIATGDEIGCIKLFDSELKLLHWYDPLNLGPLASISFAYLPKVSTR